MNAYWLDYDRRVASLEATGIDRSDAQGIVDAEDMAAGRLDARGIPFALANDPLRRQPRRFDDQLNARQRNLVDGRGDLPGQLDLFG